MIATERDKPRRRVQLVRAKLCPKCQSGDTKVYATRVIIRYCLCRECGATWKQSPAE